jgi:hypothetical protein
MKIRNVLHERNFGKVANVAKDAFDVAMRILDRGTHDDAQRANRSSGGSAQCMLCKAIVSFGCWYCVECPGTLVPPYRHVYDVADILR